MTKHTAIQAVEENVPDNGGLTAQPSLVMNLLERVLLSPELPIERVTAVMDMQERQLNKVAEQQFNAAFARAMADMPSAKKSGLNKHTRQKYSTLDDLVSASRPVLSKHGLALSWRTDIQDGWTKVTAIVRHEGGWREENSRAAPLEAGKGSGASMNIIQSHGSTETYLKRYTGFSILGMSSGDFDDDGQSTVSVQCITETQRQVLEQAINESGIGSQTFQTAYPEAADLSQFPASLYNEALERLEAFKSKRGSHAAA